MKVQDLPLAQIIRDGGMMNIFRSIGCIGDSLSSGEFEYDAQGEKGFWDCYEYSWGKQIQRITGIEMTNFSRGGLTACQLYREADTQTSPVADINRLFDPAYAKQGYIIALGVNDLKGKGNLENMYGGEMGNVQTDIDPENYKNNKGTLAGWYARIIQRLQSIQPDAKFFLMTMPNEDGSEAAFADMLKSMALRLRNCHVIDLFTYAPPYDEAFKKKYFCGHMNAMGYLLTAHYVMTYIDWIIRHNEEDFAFVQFIGSGYRPFAGGEQERQYIHISFDDVYQCIRDITVHADSLQSLFAHKFFGWLQEMHGKYGAVFSLYAFNTDSHDPDYDISGFPARYAQELTENAGWLKFGFHARDDGKKYETDEAEGIRRDYEKFTAAIRKASGGHGDCIDRVTRLGFFAGTKENIRALRECEWGPVGYLTADNSEDRRSYYFDETQTAVINREGEYYDAENRLLFLRSQLRLESVSSLEEQFARIQSYDKPKVIEVFTHESCFYREGCIKGYPVWQLMEAYIRWACERGYGFDYAQNRYSAD